MTGIARQTDRTFGVCHHPSHFNPKPVGGTILTSSETVSANGKKVARLGDKVITDCGHEGIIVTSSASAASTKNVGQQIARQNDRVDGVYKAIILTVSPTVSTQ